jgi:hypothetical protein
MQKHFFLRTFLTLTLLFLYPQFKAFSQSNADVFIGKLSQLCGKAFKGKIKVGGKKGDGFTGEELIMRVDSCADGYISIPFFVGEDKSRTWIITKERSVLHLKHDHRHKDGTPDKITMYGGMATNSGRDSIQVFPADQYTCNMIAYACANIWWFTLTDTELTYNLRRMGSERIFTVTFDLSTPIAYTDKAWGW